jgi:hypothetical protein
MKCFPGVNEALWEVGPHQQSILIKEGSLTLKPMGKELTRMKITWQVKPKGAEHLQTHGHPPH